MAGYSFVVDNSVVMSWCFADEDNAYAESVLDCLADAEAFVPAIWPLEAGNVLLAAERRKRLAEASSACFLSLLEGLPIYVEQETPERMLKEILSIGRKYGLSTYDASYLDLAMRLGMPLASLDKRLKNAAVRCGVEIFSASAKHDAD